MAKDRDWMAQYKLDMARNYLRNRVTRKARELLEKILREAPNSPAAKEARGLLEKL